jgi:hypothetical protein
MPLSRPQHTSYSLAPRGQQDAAVHPGDLPGKSASLIKTVGRKVSVGTRRGDLDMTARPL